MSIGHLTVGEEAIYQSDDEPGKILQTMAHHAGLDPRSLYIIREQNSYAISVYGLKDPPTPLDWYKEVIQAHPEKYSTEIPKQQWLDWYPQWDPVSGKFKNGFGSYVDKPTQTYSSGKSNDYIAWDGPYTYSTQYDNDYEAWTKKIAVAGPTDTTPKPASEVDKPIPPLRVRRFLERDA